MHFPPVVTNHRAAAAHNEGESKNPARGSTPGLLREKPDYFGSAVEGAAFVALFVAGRAWFALFVYFARSSGLITSIFAPASNSAFDGTLMISLVIGCGGGSTLAMSTNSTSKISVEFGSICRPLPFAP